MKFVKIPTQFSAEFTS